MRTSLYFAAVTLVLSGAVHAVAETRTDVSNGATTTTHHDAEAREGKKADNTELNKRDRNDKAVTAQDQTSDDKSMKLTQSIRRNIVERDDFSTYAKNVKIITDPAGMVTLRGPVRSTKEKEEIGRIASSLAGTGKVRNELEIAPKA